MSCHAMGGDMFDVAQEALSRCQAFPVIGVIPSVGKALLSSVQIVKGLAQGVFGALGSVVTQIPYVPQQARDFCYYNAFAGGMDTAKGVGHLAYAFFNILTLGFLGCCLEGGGRGGDSLDGLVHVIESGGRFIPSLNF